MPKLTGNPKRPKEGWALFEDGVHKILSNWDLLRTAVLEEVRGGQNEVEAGQRGGDSPSCRECLIQTAQLRRCMVACHTLPTGALAIHTHPSLSIPCTASPPFPFGCSGEAAGARPRQSTLQMTC